MKNFCAILASAATLLVTSLTGHLSAEFFGLQGGIQGGLGYRQDSIAWKVKDFEKINPTAKSKLHFKDLEIALIGGKYKGTLGGCFYTRASFDYGWVFDGCLREELSVFQRHQSGHFDCNGIMSEGRFNRAVVRNKRKNDSYVWDLDIGFGVPLDCLCEGFQIAPMIGFSYDRQQIKIKNRERIFACHSANYSQILSGEEVGDCTASSNTYRTAWWGPWIGFDFSYLVNCWSLFGEFELHLGRAERSRHSTVGIGFFDCYKRTKNYWGTTTRLGANYALCEDWYLEATVAYSHWKSNHHRDALYLSSGAIRLDVGHPF